MKLFELIDETLYKEMLDKQYINVVKHSDLNLWIIDYSNKCTLEGMWNQVTMTCRGIIIDDSNNIVAWPVYKFFNYEEIDTLASKHPELNLEIPDLPFKVFEKMDGSLGVGYWVDDKLYIATKGSFCSDQAIKANEILNSLDKNLVPHVINYMKTSNIEEKIDQKLMIRTLEEIKNVIPIPEEITTRKVVQNLRKFIKNTPPQILSNIAVTEREAVKDFILDTSYPAMEMFSPHVIKSLARSIEEKINDN